MNTVHVCAWASDGSGGFDWYANSQDADKAFEVEKNNCHEFSDDHWRAYRFEVKVAEDMSSGEITDFIDRDLRHYCNTATISYCHETTPTMRP